MLLAVLIVEAVALTSTSSYSSRGSSRGSSSVSKYLQAAQLRFTTEHKVRHTS